MNTFKHKYYTAISHRFQQRHREAEHISFNFVTLNKTSFIFFAFILFFQKSFIYLVLFKVAESAPAIYSFD